MIFQNYLVEQTWIKIQFVIFMDSSFSPVSDLKESKSCTCYCPIPEFPSLEFYKNQQLSFNIRFILEMAQTFVHSTWFLFIEPSIFTKKYGIVKEQKHRIYKRASLKGIQSEILRHTMMTSHLVHSWKNNGQWLDFDGTLKY